MITESLSPTSRTKVGHNLNPLRPAEVVHEEYHPEHAAPHLHLPSTTADFLNDVPPESVGKASGKHALQETPAGPNVPPRAPRRNREGVDEGKLHHLNETVVVRPPGLDYSPGTEHEVRRPSVWSSDSHYSIDSFDTEGTIDSDDEARDLLAHADSGPMPVHHAEDDEGVGELPAPSEDQVKRAKAVLMMKK